jgi:hypothetical protein
VILPAVAWTVFCSVAIFVGCAPVLALDSTHKLFNQELAKYCKNGLVDYSAWQKKRGPLEQYIGELTKAPAADYEKLSRDDQKALWLNVYNAYTIKLVLDNYPINGKNEFYPTNSIRQVPGFWEGNQVVICGKKVTLDEIEHNILRRDFRDPRTHFAVCAAALGSGKLTKAFIGSTLDKQLDEAAVTFLSDPNNVKLNVPEKSAHVSKTFAWFPLDFSCAAGMSKKFPPPTDDEIVLSYILKKAPPAVTSGLTPENLREFEVVYDDYDWTLNDKNDSNAKNAVIKK